MVIPYVGAGSNPAVPTNFFSIKKRVVKNLADKNCQACGGTGGRWTTCSRCNGKGKVDACRACNGKGSVGITDLTCSRCEGRGIS